MFTLVCGLYNAGKTTYSLQFDNALHLDELGSTDKVCERMEDEIVVEGVFGHPRQRKKLLAAYTGGYKRCIFLDVPLDEIIRREDRGRPKSYLRHHAATFQPPTYSEGWDEIIRIDGTGVCETVLQEPGVE